jgi:hypothetical protein
MGTINLPNAPVSAAGSFRPPWSGHRRRSSGRMRIQHLPLMRTERDVTRSASCEITLDVVEPHSTEDRLEKRLLALCFTPSQSRFGANLGTRGRSHSNQRADQTWRRISPLGGGMRIAVGESRSRLSEASRAAQAVIFRDSRVARAPRLAVAKDVVEPDLHLPWPGQTDCVRNLQCGRLQPSDHDSPDHCRTTLVPP